MSRLRFTLALLVVGLLTSGFLMGEDKKDEKEPIVVSAKLPTYFSKLNLSTKQKSDILRVRAKYAIEADKLKQQLEKLKQQIADMKEQEMVDAENLLTTAQKARLKEIRDGKSNKGKGKDKDNEIKDKPAEVKKK
jgi:flagellar basal body-associated protein FliL